MLVFQSINLPDKGLMKDIDQTQLSKVCVLFP